MANEFKLSYTASDINRRLGLIDNLANKNELPNYLSDEDILEFIINTGYVNPVIADSNKVFTDNNNNVYIL